ncbi:MAG: RMD1 family protein [Sulfuricurvum sp.]|uniref:RMD1 family protein n=1 Tax=Sulfuricurvum sp. TaxID=2025608 RepID=UPI00260676B8|nr:RMD1 family protein [Sulfuricurvum sp.]MDD2839177.1 RMD1 family protein [Sulfuricurvum sp.]MDD3595358.1 RMD1 family protein [Sulfuricurvum sp.]
MNLLSLYLDRPLTKATIEYSLELQMNKGVENGYYGRNDLLHVVLSPFGVLSLIAEEKKTILHALSTLGIIIEDESDTITQDYPIHIDPLMEERFKVTNEAIYLREVSTLNLNVIALAISQSVGLERYEKRLDTLFMQSRRIVESIQTFSITRRSHLMQFAKRLALTRHDMVSNLLLLDKPNILWDNEEAEALYNRLAFILELYDRHEIALSKLAQIKEDVMLVMDLINHKKSEFLEWIIIVLIAVEIAMGLMQMIK